ncbi:hypothetical protein P153DRAFT_390390 [Dothidotthia symphoricarpi CBS 119687]|uniref:Myb-like domain-containing protein n=1 Tax=Dothidotthia symphoricarpi CBS 119687 TaxID=1392245 RepID=A0A6A5ZYI3_9PLEO|nr:uncharacterized protein P153DRAFT_390390 [Dothidotthia symphoricarpi CBS 119687]KAF2124356.1 hypothetical protein P153DRAFT_390390 [Dothidotthia symphoricarpi CBS 119687]
MSQQNPTSYDVGYASNSRQSTDRKRGYAEEHLQHEDPNMRQQISTYGQATGSVSLGQPSQGYPFQEHPPLAATQSALPPTHHHHLPSTHRDKRQRREGSPPSPTPQHGPPSVVGQQGMPNPAARPRGPKLKFTNEDDQLLVDLKEKKNLTWKQIADFFPGRSSGTLQVRYCTKLKAKTTVWTDEMVQKLHTAMHEYENDRWRIISSKVGSGFSPAACRDKALEFDAGEPPGEDQEQEHSGYADSPTVAGGPSDLGPPYQ